MQTYVGSEQLFIGTRIECARVVREEHLALFGNVRLPHVCRSRRSADANEVKGFGRRDADVDADAPNTGLVALPDGKELAVSDEARTSRIGQLERSRRESHLAATRDTRLRGLPFET